MSGHNLHREMKETASLKSRVVGLIVRCSTFGKSLSFVSPLLSLRRLKTAIIICHPSVSLDSSEAICRQSPSREEGERASRRPKNTTPVGLHELRLGWAGVGTRPPTGPRKKEEEHLNAPSITPLFLSLKKRGGGGGVGCG